MAEDVLKRRAELLMQQYKEGSYEHLIAFALANALQYEDSVIPLSTAKHILRRLKPEDNFPELLLLLNDIVKREEVFWTIY